MIRLKNIITLILAPLMIAIYLILASTVDINSVEYKNKESKEVQYVEILSSEEEMIEPQSDVMEFNIKDVSDLYTSVVELRESLAETRKVLKD